MIDMFDFGDGAGPVPAHRHPNGGGWVADTAFVAPTAYVGPDARVFGGARVRENTFVCDGAEVFGRAQLSGHAAVRDKAQARGGSQLSGNAVVSGNAIVSGTARMRGDALVFGGKWLNSPLFIEGSRHSVTMCAPGMLAIGCQVHSIENWLSRGREIGREHDYSDAQLEEYERYIRLAAEMYLEEGAMRDDENGLRMPRAEREGESHEDFFENGKSAINELLWRFAPRNARLGELDDAAVFIFDHILLLWREDHE